ncbi:MAG: radical SAM protein [Rhizomicrobium sp.]
MARTISYLRISVTDRCDFRCVYCMAEHTTFLPRAEVLSLAEIERLAMAFVRKGTKRLRITGGEPLVRRNVMQLFDRLGAQIGRSNLQEITLTTNGSQLARFARGLRSAGVERVNVSLDTLDEEKFKAITRWGALGKVLDGIDAAGAAGLAIKINTVALKGVNEDEIEDLMLWGAQPRLRSHPDRDHADGHDRRRPRRPVPAAVARPRPPRPQLHLRRVGASHRRPLPAMSASPRPAGVSASSRR